MHALCKQALQKQFHWHVEEILHITIKSSPDEFPHQFFAILAKRQMEVCCFDEVVFEVLSEFVTPGRADL